MTREDRALTLLASANPVPDARVFERGEARRVHLDDVEQWSDEMTDTKLREIETGGGRQRPPWLVGALAALLVVVVGLAALFIMRDDADEPDVATTVTTAAVAQLPTVTWTSDDCVYEGPTEFSFGETVTMVLVNDTDAFGGTELYFVGEGTFLPDDGDIPMWLGDEFFGVKTTPGDSSEFSVSPSEAGNWVVMCGTTGASATEQTPNIDRYATIIRFAP